METQCFCCQIKLKEALNNFFTSPAWEEMKATGEKIRVRLLEEGVSGAWDEFIVSIDPEGETHAYRVSVSGREDGERNPKTEDRVCEL